MTRLGALLVAVVLLSTVTVAVPSVAATQSPDAASGPVATTQSTPSQQAASSSANNSSESLSPGARLAGVISVQEEDVKGDLERRAFGVRVAQSASENATAAVVAGSLASIESRIQETEREMRRLREARQNGTITDGEYQARVAAMVTRTEQLQRLTNQTEQTARTLPEPALQRAGVNATAAQRIQQNTQSLTGPETAAIARNVTGSPQQPGATARQGGQATVGTNQSRNRSSAQAEQVVRTAERIVENARKQIETATARGANESDLQPAMDALASAEASLETAEAALDAGRNDEAVASAERAIERATKAQTLATSAQARGQSSTNGQGQGQPPANGNRTTGASNGQGGGQSNP